jgi:hypothetical protein
MDINYKGSQGQTERAVVLQEEEKEDTAEVPIRSQVSICEIYSGQSGTWTGFSPSASRFSSVIIIQPVFHNYQLPASLLASFLCKLNMFRKWDKNVVTGKEIIVETECK